MTTFCENLKQLRLKKNLTQEQAALALGVSPQSISRWECMTTLPDVTMLPKIAELYCVSIDELYALRPRICVADIPKEKMEFLLQTYSQMYAPEAGPWNLSPENHYLMYRFSDFFEKHFPVEEGFDICNIGIGAGEWDHYLSYKLKGGSLTSIDRLENCCRQLEERLICEGNPGNVTVLCADAMDLALEKRFDIVTMVGSTMNESDNGLALLKKVFGFVKPSGSIYIQSMDAREDWGMIMQMAFLLGFRLAAYFEDDTYGFQCRYYRFVRT